MTPRRRGVAPAVACLLACLAAACTSSPPSRPASPPASASASAPSDPSAAPSAAHVWVTTPDGRQRLADGGTVPLVADPGTPADVVVDDRETRQPFAGVGASLTGSSATVLRAMPDGDRDALMRDLFTRDGIGLSVLRQPLGASDFSPGQGSYDDQPPGRTDPGLDGFSLGSDGTDVVPLLRQAAALNPALAVVLTPWSAPGWMKTGGSLVGGTLDARHAGAYADYLVAAVRAYRDAGVPVRGLTLQNEPSFSPPGYAGMTLDVAQQRSLLVDHLAPALDRAGLSPHLWVLDDNFSRVDDADALLSDPAVRRASYGVAFHCYEGDVGALRTLRARHPGVPLAVSECSNGAWSTSFGDDLRFEARTLLLGAVRGGAEWLVKWNLVLDPQGGPTDGGCRRCRGLVGVDPATGRVERSAAYDAWGHVGRFVVPGARVLATRATSPVATVAFRNPDGSHVLVAFNEADTPAPLRVRWQGRSLAQRVDPGALVTLTW